MSYTDYIIFIHILYENHISFEEWENEYNVYGPNTFKIYKNEDNFCNIDFLLKIITFYAEMDEKKFHFTI